MNNVIFCDFDGVIVSPYDYYKINNGKISYKTKLEPLYNNKIVALHMLFNMLHLDTYFIPVSSWSDEFKDKNNLQLFFNDLGLTHFKPSDSDMFYIIDSNRSESIKKYIDTYNITNYIILDDEHSSEYKKLNLTYIKTDKFAGLTNKNIYDIQSIIKSW